VKREEKECISLNISYAYNTRSQGLVVRRIGVISNSEVLLLLFLLLLLLLDVVVVVYGC
jgi:hypothetical protein